MAATRGGDELVRFAADLRSLLAKAGMSYRKLAQKAHYSRTALSAAAAGRTMPSLPVTLAFVGGCGGDRREWERRWHALHQITHGPAATASIAAPPWPAQPVADGAEPESSGSAADAITVHARRIALTGRRHIVGQVELRYSARTHAAWARFEGFDNLDYLAAHRHHVEIVVEVVRTPDGQSITFREDYTFEYHWTELLRTGEGRLLARAAIYFDGKVVASGDTDAFALA